MATVKATIRKKTGTTWDEIRPKTEVAQIVDFAANVPSALNGLSDVTIASPSNGQVLKYDGGIWKNLADSNTADTNTTYSVSAVDHATDANSKYIRLTGSDATTDDIRITAGTNVGIVRNGDQLIISSSASGSTFNGGTITGDLSFEKEIPTITLNMETDVAGNGGRIVFADASAVQDVQLRFNHYDSERPPFGLVIERGPNNTQTTSNAYLQVQGEIYANSTQRVFADDYHPNADKLTTTRNIALTGAVTGNADFDGSGNISIATTHTADPVITLTGAVTGSGTMTNLGNVSIATTATADPTLTLSGDASGSATFTNLGNATLSVTVNNIDGVTFRNGNSGSGTNPDNINENGTSYINSVSLFGQTDGALYSQAYSTSWVHQIFGDYRTGQLAMRIWQQSFGSGTAYSNYADVWHTGNLTNLNQLSNGPGYVTSSGVTSVATGGGLTGGTITGTGTISHADTSSQASVNNSGRTYIQDITLDTYGHIIGISSATETVTNTDTNYYLTGVSGSGNGTVTFTRQSLGNLTWNASHTHDDRYYTESESLSLFLRRDVYNSANSGLQVFRNLGTATGSWGDNDHTFGLENSDAGYLTMNFHRAGYTSNNLLYTGTYFNFDLELRVNNSTVWNTGNLTNLNQLSNGPGYVTSSGVTSVATGGGLTGGTITSTGTISHADTSSQGSVNNSGNTFIQDITLDTYGHITAITSATANNVGNADTVDGYHAVAFVRNVYSEFLDSAFPAAPLTTTFTSWSKPVGMPSVTLEANSRYYVFAAGSYYTAATTTGIGISPTFSTVSGQIRGGQIYINTSTSTTAGTSEFSANWRTMSTSGGQTGNFALGTAGPTANPGNEFGFYGIVETSGNSTVLSMHIRSEVSGSAVNVNRLALTAMKLPT